MNAVAVVSSHPSSGSDSWVTPKSLAEALGAFDFDPCSNSRSHINAGCRCTLDGPGNAVINGSGLEIGWHNWSVFVNPGYSNVTPWAARLVAHEGPWVALLKLDPTTKWWATLMSANPTVAPFRKRIAFETDRQGKTMTAVFPSVLVFSAWRPPAALRPYLWLPTWEVR